MQLTFEKRHFVQFLYRVSKIIQEMKKSLLKTVDEKEKFKSSFDWNKMTIQDEAVWKEIFKVINND